MGGGGKGENDVMVAIIMLQVHHHTLTTPYCNMHNSNDTVYYLYCVYRTNEKVRDRLRQR